MDWHVPRVLQFHEPPTWQNNICIATWTWPMKQWEHQQLCILLKHCNNCFFRHPLYVVVVGIFTKSFDSSSPTARPLSHGRQRQVMSVYLQGYLECLPFLSGETVLQTFSTTRRKHKNGEKMSGQLFPFYMIIEKWRKDVRHSWHHFPTKMIDENREKMSDILDNFSPFCTGEKLSGEMLSGHHIF